MYAFAPDGTPIRGTLERIAGVALITQGSFGKTADDFDHAGEIEVWWDDQETVTTATDETVFVDDDGYHWLAPQLVLTDDENWQPEPDAPGTEMVEGYHPPRAAAYPEVLAALHKLLAWVPPTPPDYETLGPDSFSPEARFLIDRQNEARAALAKAEGRAS